MEVTFWEKKVVKNPSNDCAFSSPTVRWQRFAWLRSQFHPSSPLMLMRHREPRSRALPEAASSLSPRQRRRRLSPLGVLCCSPPNGFIQHAVQLGNEAGIRQTLGVEKGATYSVTFSAARTCAQLEQLNVSSGAWETSATMDLQMLYSVEGWDTYAHAFQVVEDTGEVAFLNQGIEEILLADPSLTTLLSRNSSSLIDQKELPTGETIIFLQLRVASCRFGNAEVGFTGNSGWGKVECWFWNAMIGYQKTVAS